MTKFVKIRHPVTKGEALVPEISVRHWERSGWQRVRETAQVESKKKPEPSNAKPAT